MSLLLILLPVLVLLAVSVRLRPISTGANRGWLPTRCCGAAFFAELLGEPQGRNGLSIDFARNL